MPPIYQSAPDDADALIEIEQMRLEITSVLKLQECAQVWLRRVREKQEEADKNAAAEAQRAIDYALAGASRGWERPASIDDPELSPDEEDDGTIFNIRNLDTGEATAVPLGDEYDSAAPGALSPMLASKLSFGELQPHSEAWDACKVECRGLLEKLASKSTLSFRSYQLCVWQVRRARTLTLARTHTALPNAPTRQTRHTCMHAADGLACAPHVMHKLAGALRVCRGRCPLLPAAQQGADAERRAQAHPVHVDAVRRPV